MKTSINKNFFSLMLVVLLIAFFPGMALAGKGDVVSLGADLTLEQREGILEGFGVTEHDVEIITVTIQDVKNHLENASSKDIGTKAISSAYVKLLSKGKGIFTEVENITLITAEMYANALVTAGVKDAEIRVMAPFKVTGTTALTGIMMAFEEATGQKLNIEAKKTANEELRITQEISNDFDQDKATELIKNIKIEVLDGKIKNPEDIRKVIIKIADELGIKLTEEQIDQILKLMEKISKLDINVDSILNQLDKINQNLEIVKKTINENKGFIQNIIDLFLNWLRSIFGLIYI